MDRPWTKADRGSARPAVAISPPPPPPGWPVPPIPPVCFCPSAEYGEARSSAVLAPVDPLRFSTETMIPAMMTNR